MSDNDIVYGRKCDRCGDRREWGNNLLCDHCANIVAERYTLAIKKATGGGVDWDKIPETVQPSELKLYYRNLEEG